MKVYEDSTILPILRFYLKIVMKVMCRFHDSSDSTVLPQDFYESEVPILRFSAVDERTRYIRGFYVQLSCYHFLIHDNLKVKS